MKKIIYFFTLLSIASCNTNNDTPFKEINKHSNVSIQNETIEISNQFYKHFVIQSKQQKEDIILNISQTEKITKGTNISDSYLEIKPYNFKNNWTISAKAHDIEVLDNSLTTIFKAYGETEDTYGLYNLKTGNHLFDCTYDMLKVKIPNADFKRYIGYTSRSNANNLLKNEAKNVVGIISYASENSLIKQYLVKTTKDIGIATPDMELVSFSENAKLFEGNQLLYFWDLDSNYKTSDIDFAFGYTYYIGEESEETAIMFEVVNDELLLKNTKYDTQVFEIIEK